MLAELDSFIGYCNDKGVDKQLITDINIKTLTYIKNCNKQKPTRNIQMTRKYLKEHNLLAIPFDKGIGFCLMKSVTYEQKIKSIIDLPQFEKYVPERRNEKHPVLKEEEKVISLLKDLLKEGLITEQLYKKLKPIGSQPPRLYGLAKVHKKDTPLRPVLSMPGSAYHKIGEKVAEWLSVVPECRINSSSKIVSESLKNIKLNENEVIVSFDVSSLYTNVPVQEAIDDCTDLLFSGRYTKPPINRDTFKKLITICTRDVLMSTSLGYYRQIDGLAMGSPPAPLIANGWLSKFDHTIQDTASLYSRYMDDVIREIDRHRVTTKLHEINNLHPSLKFTIEEENEDSTLPFLDMKIIRTNSTLASTWYSKPTDTGLTMNFYAQAPMKYKRSLVIGLVHRIYRCCSSWKYFHESIAKAKMLLKKNQYPETFYEPIIKKTLTNIVMKKEKTVEEEEKEMKLIFVEYRGRVSENYEKSLKRCAAPCKVIFTLRKVKTCLPSLKPAIDKPLRSRIVYQFKCPRCHVSYVGQTSRHLLTRFKEHKRSVVGNHFKTCEQRDVTIDDVTVIDQSLKSITHLETLEALWIEEIRPELNTKDEYKSHQLLIKI